MLSWGLQNERWSWSPAVVELTIGAGGEGGTWEELTIDASVSD